MSFSNETTSRFGPGASSTGPTRWVFHQRGARASPTAVASASPCRSATVAIAGPSKSSPRSSRWTSYAPARSSGSASAAAPGPWNASARRSFGLCCARSRPRTSASQPSSWIENRWCVRAGGRSPSSGAAGHVIVWTGVAASVPSSRRATSRNALSPGSKHDGSTQNRGAAERCVATGRSFTSSVTRGAGRAGRPSHQHRPSISISPGSGRPSRGRTKATRRGTGSSPWGSSTRRPGPAPGPAGPPPMPPSIDIAAIDMAVIIDMPSPPAAPPPAPASATRRTSIRSR
ncbi:MAG: hypothetical protein ACYTG1_06830 [Planctomycetota bacterium]